MIAERRSAGVGTGPSLVKGGNLAAKGRSGTQEPRVSEVANSCRKCSQPDLTARATALGRSSPITGRDLLPNRSFASDVVRISLRDRRSSVAFEALGISSPEILASNAASSRPSQAMPGAIQSLPCKFMLRNGQLRKQRFNMVDSLECRALKAKMGLLLIEALANLLGSRSIVR